MLLGVLLSAYEFTRNSLKLFLRELEIIIDIKSLLCEKLKHITLHIRLFVRLLQSKTQFYTKLVSVVINLCCASVPLIFELSKTNFATSLIT
jgi:hypothetical protein